MMTERPGLGSPLGPRPPLAPPRAHPGPPRPPIGPRSSLGPRPPHTNGSSMARSPGGPGPRPPGAQGPPARPPGFGSDDSDKSLKMKIKRTKSGRQEIVAVGEGERSDGEGSRDSSCSPVRRPPSPAATPPSTPTAPDLTNGVRAAAGRRGRVDAGTSTDAATLTEPEALGPCEPGTAVSLEGIVWHETDAGVLVVNVTWRGKTYVGTLLDCTRHTNQWSAPRFTDSPEPGGKGGRGKRGRTSTTSQEVLEPRKNLRSSKAKGKGKGSKGKEEEFAFPAPSSPAKDCGKRKGRPDDLEEAKKRKRNAGSDQEDEKTENEEEEEKEEEPAPPPPAPRREPRPVVYSYRMLECPRRECSKQYKEEEGLRWHLSHSHPEYIDPSGAIKDAATVEREQEERKRRARARREVKAEERAGGAPPAAKLPKAAEGGKVAGPPRPVARPAAGAPQPPRLPGQLPAGLIAKTKVPEAAAGPSQPPANPPLEEVKRRGAEAASPGPPSPPATQEKPPATSPAYSDISDDGEDSRGAREPPAPAKPPAPLLAPPRSQPPPPRVSTPMSTYQPASSSSSYSAPSSTPSRPSSRPSPSLISPSCGPNPGTPEYHKYLAANGFPPFPYPYPVGMDPNYHVQLLKTDHMYKMKWEKDRAEREKAFKDQLDRDQGKFSGLNIVKEERKERREKAGEELRKREPSGGGRSATPSISVKAEFKVKDEVKVEDAGVKPTMETRGPPPGPGAPTFGYMHPSLLRPGGPPYSMAPGMAMPPHFDPIMASAMMGSQASAMMGSPYGLPAHGLPPYLSPGLALGPRPPGFPADPLRSPFPGLPSPEELARAGALAGGPPGMSGTKALDLLQQHASQYYANQKLAELQERALKSPSSGLSSSAPSPSPSLQAAKPVTTLAGKDSPTPTTSATGAKSPPPLRHVHTHTHTHIGLGYPLLPPVAGSLPPGPPGLPPGALPPPPALPPAPPFPPAPYPGKSPGTQ